MPISILIVDDTITYRKLLSEVVATIPGTEASATAASGKIALQKLAHARYDLVLLDIQMPEMDGLETLGHIQRDFPGVDVAMVTGVTENAAEISMKALKLGALDLVRKPSGRDAADSFAQIQADLTPLVRLVERKRLNGKTAASAAPPRPQSAQVQEEPRRFAATPRNFGVLCVGVSTGGPRALMDVIPALPADFPLPVVVVQHMPPVFTEALARDLDRRSKLTVLEAKEGSPVSAGSVLLAPGGRHMVLRSGEDGAITAGLNDGPPENSCRPAVDVLFRSVAACYGDQGVLALIMTGMGSDGMKGVQALKRKGCYCISQSASTCVVYGMPQAVDAAGLSDESRDLADIPARLVELASKRRRT